MKKVEFVQINSVISGWNPLYKGGKFTFEKIEETIRERIQDGWEYSGWVPLNTRSTGDVESISLIFQKDE